MRPTASHPTLLALDSAWADLFAAIDAVPTEASITPNVIGSWSVVDLMRHLTAWADASAAHTGAPVAMTPLEIAAFNAATRRSAPPPDPIAAHAALVRAHTALRARVVAVLAAGDETAGTCACGVEGIADHYASHAAEVRAAWIGSVQPKSSSGHHSGPTEQER